MDELVERFALRLSADIREAVLPHLGRPHARRTLSRAVGGDATFSIDEVAEEILRMRLEAHGDVAYYSEDKGLVSFGRPRYILVVDPIDGSRPAAAGLESCCVSIALTEKLDNPHLGDVVFGIVQEIKSGRLFIARKGKGLEIRVDGDEEMPHLSQNRDLSTLFWTIGFRGRPAMPLITVLGELLDISTLNGAAFDLGSASFGITRLVTGQLDAYLDVGERMIAEVPGVEAEFRRVAGGAVLNNSPYDIAAAKLVAEEAGCVITDARGESLDGRPLLGSTPEFQISCIAASSADLHRAIAEQVSTGIERLKAQSAIPVPPR